MQFGVQLPTYWSDYGSAGPRQALVETASLSNELGFDSIWCNDHVITPAQGRPVGTIVEPLITLASLSHLIPDQRLGTSVLVLPQRNAVVVAKQTAALDLLSDGRLILGIGVGWNEPEFDFLNADFQRRGRHTDEAIQVMRTLWQSGHASFHGEFYQFKDAVFEPKPRQERIPVWIGGNSPAAIRRAARFGDAWSPFGIGATEYRQGVTALRQQVGDRPVPLLAAHLMLHLPENGSRTNRGHVGGSPSEVVDTLGEYTDAGMEYLVCGFEADGLDDWLRQARTFAEQVRPHL